MKNTIKKGAGVDLVFVELDRAGMLTGVRLLIADAPHRIGAGFTPEVRREVFARGFVGVDEDAIFIRPDPESARDIGGTGQRPAIAVGVFSDLPAPEPEPVRVKIRARLH